MCSNSATAWNYNPSLKDNNKLGLHAQDCSSYIKKKANIFTSKPYK